MRNYPKINIYITFIIVFAAMFTKYLPELTAAMIVYNILFIYFWKEKRPVVFLGAMLFQWLSVVTGYFYMAFFNKSPDFLLWFPSYSLEKLNEAYWLGLITILVLSSSIKLALRNIELKELNSTEAKKYSFSKLIILYLIFDIVIFNLFEKIRFTPLAGLSQSFYMLSAFKWSLFFIILFKSFHEKRFLLAGILILFDVLLGFTGYFSAFKDYLLFFILVYLTLNKIKSMQLFFAIFAGILIFMLGVFWSYVKSDYRSYLSGGKRAQIVTVSKLDALNKLISYIPEFNNAKFEVGTEALVKRIFYLEFFSATIKNIPTYDPYMKGKNWNQAITHVLMPRFFFPNKEAVDDSKNTFLLTRIKVADAKQGTSISVGYAGESYADFGPFFMFFPIALLGFIIGLYYKFLVNNSFGVWKYAIIFPIFFLINFFEKNLIKVIGDLVWFFIIFFLIVKFLPLIDRFLTKSEYK